MREHNIIHRGLWTHAILLLLIMAMPLLGATGCGGNDLNGNNPGILNADCTDERYNVEAADCAAVDVCDPDVCMGPIKARCATEDPLRFAQGASQCVLLEANGPLESCMQCHNGANENNYSGNGMTNPHPFGAFPTNNVRCSTCHGGNPESFDKVGAHVPAPPEMGTVQDWIGNPAQYEGYWNRLTLAGVDKYNDYTVEGQTFTGMDYLRFLNPSDLRVVEEDKGCGTPGCHKETQAEWVPRHPFGLSNVLVGGGSETVGMDNFFNDTSFNNTVNSFGSRSVVDERYNERRADPNQVGIAAQVREIPERSGFLDPYFDNVIAANLNNDVYQFNQVDNPGNIKTNAVRAAWNYGGDPAQGSALAHTVMNALTVTCGDCHLGSKGQNNRYGDFRSSGCAACHMEYAPDGRSRSGDPHVGANAAGNFPILNPDDIYDSEVPQIPRMEIHQIRNRAKNLPGGAFVRGISDYACVGCHQGSNRTVLQYWGIRMDQNADVVNNFQYPANPVNFTTTQGDPRLYSAAVGNNTFNGRDFNQHLLTEDYDGDGRDDTAPDVHYAAGLGCIDCHGARDVHNGTEGDPTSGGMVSSMSQAVQIQCESCHGSEDSYAITVPCEDYDGNAAECVVDLQNNPLRHVTRRNGGDFYLVSRVNAAPHYVPQTYDTIRNNNKLKPNNQTVFSYAASFAMGRFDGNDNTGVGPQQENRLVPAADRNANYGAVGFPRDGFSHMDNLDCVSCHASWTNNCIGCHLRNEHDADPNNYFFSNITGKRVKLAEQDAAFTYQNPLHFVLGVNARGKVGVLSPSQGMFYRYTDANNNDSDVFAFSDRRGNGNNPSAIRDADNNVTAINNLGHGPQGALSWSSFRPHSVRGRVDGANEGPRYCVACHMTEDGLKNWDNLNNLDYRELYDVVVTRQWNTLTDNETFPLLQQCFGQNPSNQLNWACWSLQVAGLGTGLYLFDRFGCPVNPLDNNANRQICDNGAPAENFANYDLEVNDPNEDFGVPYCLDCVVEGTGAVAPASAGRSNAGTREYCRTGSNCTTLRDGENDNNINGPLGRGIVDKLAHPDFGVVLSDYCDADGQAHGNLAINNNWCGN